MHWVLITLILFYKLHKSFSLNMHKWFYSPYKSSIISMKNKNSNFWYIEYRFLFLIIIEKQHNYNNFLLSIKIQWILSKMWKLGNIFLKARTCYSKISIQLWVKNRFENNNEGICIRFNDAVSRPFVFTDQPPLWEFGQTKL